MGCQVSFDTFNVPFDSQPLDSSITSWYKGPPSWPTRSPVVRHVQPISYIACISPLLVKWSLTASNNSPLSALTWHIIRYACRPIQSSGTPRPLPLDLRCSVDISPHHTKPSRIWGGSLFTNSITSGIQISSCCPRASLYSLDSSPRPGPFELLG